MVLDSTPEQLTAIDSALEKNDLKTIAKVTHKLKGMFANVGAEALHYITLDLEDLARQGEMKAEIFILVDRLQMAFVSLKSELKNNDYNMKFN